MLSSQVPLQLVGIDKGSVMNGCTDRKTCCRSPMCRLRD